MMGRRGSGTTALAAGVVATLVTGALAASQTDPLAIEVEPATVTAGSRDARARLRARAPDGREVDARWVTQIGRVEHGAWVPGDRRAPGLAVIAAAAPDGNGEEWRGASVVRFIGRGELPTHTEPGASVTVEVAGRIFGPVVADARGDARVTVEVPPGVAQAVVTATDPDGRSTARSVALPVVPGPAWVVLPPARLAGDARGVVTVFAVDERGGWRPITAPPPEVTVSGAGARPAGIPHAVAPGRWDVDVVADPQASDGEARVHVVLDGRALPDAVVPVAAAARAEAAAPGGAGVPAGTWLLGARAGVAASFGDLTSAAAGLDLVWLVRRDVGLAFELGLAYGSGSTSHGIASDIAVSQIALDVAAQLRVPLGRARVVLAGGIGTAFASTTRNFSPGNAGPMETVDTGFAPLFYLGTGATFPLGPGEILVDVRWIEARFDPDRIHVEGTALGLCVAAGYRLRL
jgi:hypothetical protein